MVNNITITSTSHTTPAVLGSVMEFVATLVHNRDSRPPFTIHVHVDGAFVTVMEPGVDFGLSGYSLAVNGTWERV